VQISFFSVSVSVQCAEQVLTYGDEFRICQYEVKSAVFKTVIYCAAKIIRLFLVWFTFFAQKLPMMGSQSLNYHNKCSQIKPTSMHRSFYGNSSLDGGSEWVDVQRPSIWTEAAVKWLTKWFLPQNDSICQQAYYNPGEGGLHIKRTGVLSGNLEKNL